MSGAEALKSLPDELDISRGAFFAPSTALLSRRLDVIQRDPTLSQQSLDGFDYGMSLENNY